ncbi:MAG: FTR1 family protein [Aigarchaeota archaeon]|nr:FTR1 family protein [Candidatus Pelearchaeum maunauluense]
MVFAEALITLREGFEAALIVSIILAYLSKTGRKILTKYVKYGVYTALFASILLGSLSWMLYGALSGATKALFEGVAAWLAVVVLSTMILWMATKAKSIKTEIESRVEQITTRGTVIGLTAFSFVIVFREGLETVLFIIPFLVRNPLSSSIGSFLGAAVAVALAYALFFIGMRLNIRRFFYITSILLVLLAGGLAGYGTHELIEFAEDSGISLGWFAQTAYALPIPTDSLLHDKNVIGSIFAVLFGYTVKAEIGRLAIQLAYLMTALPLVIRAYKKD